ncbi:NAD(P)H-hydrate dehydratase [Crenobacter sp. SG2305]|uniref:NAD(P)H-hydrate dehydratase n=1 Tax=Crenobacter oryzisoli TaxID=3056844 RepID=UPI0025AA77E5|nr:NAD(P)H-hydrate dehydratase [Crenobacter sp. SG2305]MDN0081877.1 NAD(P)H-hydrate dehydratase [Crenobacter sp. SG2305]
MSAAEPIYSLSSLRELEQRADAAGLNLMQRAAQAAADWLASRFAAGSRVLIAAGPGNNGGDALWLAIHLANRGDQVELLVPAEPTSALALEALAACRVLGLIEHTALDTVTSPDALVDGLFGIGLSRPLEGDWATLIEKLNTLPCPRFALDTPSGLDSWTGYVHGIAIRADETLTFLCAKPGLHTADGTDYAGTVSLATLNVPAELLPTPNGELNRADARALIRSANSHKGSNGTVAVVGGAPGMLGAALLAGRSTLAGGAGKVYLCALDTRLPVDPVAPELMFAPPAQALKPGIGVVAIGPGLGKSGKARHWLYALLAQPSAKVVDADALNLIAADPELAERLSNSPAAKVLTPHPAEAARLLGVTTPAIQADRVSAAQALAKRFQSIVVLKGAGSIIARPDSFCRVNVSGGPALAVAGQGDVLSGVIAALLAQGMPPFDAASLAVRAHGLAGDAYTTEQGGPLGLTASATLAYLIRALNRLMTPNDATA